MLDIDAASDFACPLAGGKLPSSMRWIAFGICVDGDFFKTIFPLIAITQFVSEGLIGFNKGFYGFCLQNLRRPISTGNRPPPVHFIMGGPGDTVVTSSRRTGHSVAALCEIGKGGFQFRI